jgi:hypothetical protein
MKKALLIVAVMLVAAAVACSAQEAKPDFSGKWVLNVEKSEFAPLPPPESGSRVIDHKDPKMKITETNKGQRGERTTEREITTDGQENKNTFPNGEYVSKSHWNGSKLVTEGRLQLQDNEIGIKETTELSKDGKTLTLKRQLSSPQGEAVQKLVYIKQE